MELGERVSRLIVLADKLARATSGFFEKKGAGPGDRATNEFMDELRRHANEIFGKDYSQAKICGKNNFAVDFYFPEEQAVVEFAFSLHQPMNEFERDIFKCLLAQDAGYAIQKLILVGKPGAQARNSAPAPRAISDFVKGRHNLEIDLWELVPEETHGEGFLKTG